MSAAQEKAAVGVSSTPAADQKADTPILGQQPEIAKRETTLIAQFALAGHAVHSLADGGYLVTKWGQARHCPDLHALAGFARQIGAIQ